MPVPFSNKRCLPDDQLTLLTNHHLKLIGWPDNWPNSKVKPMAFARWQDDTLAWRLISNMEKNRDKKGALNEVVVQ